LAPLHVKKSSYLRKVAPGKKQNRVVIQILKLNNWIACAEKKDSALKNRLKTNLNIARAALMS
jgi:hypothetical protein